MSCGFWDSSDSTESDKGGGSSAGGGGGSELFGQPPCDNAFSVIEAARRWASFTSIKESHHRIYYERVTPVSPNAEFA